jgi:ribosomal protein L15
LAKSSDKEIKILSVGEITRELNIKGILVSGKTKEKIEAAGGKVE